MDSSRWISPVASLLRLTDDSPVAYAVHGLEGNSGLLRGWLSSNFKDEHLEAAYQKDRKHTVEARGRFVASGVAGLFLLLALAIIVVGPVCAPTFYVAAACGFECLVCVGLRLLFAFRQELATRIYDEVMCFIGFTALAFTTASRDRFARMFGLSDDAWEVMPFMEANSVLASTAAMVLICNILRLPPCATFVLIASGLAINIVFTLSLGSMEFEHMNAVRMDTGGSAGSLTIDYANLALKQLACGLMIWYRSRYNEDVWRHAFAGLYLARRKSEQEQDQNRALLQRIEDLTQTDNLVRKALRHQKSPKVEKQPSLRRESFMVPYPAEAEVMRVRANARVGHAASASLKPNAVLVKALQGRRTSWDRICRLAANIRSPSYSLRNYHDDCLACFPELSLFWLEAGGSSSGGRLSSMEYQRTMGSLFAVYWLLRLEFDGKVGFVYGVDENWNVVEPTDMSEVLEDMAKDFIHMRDSERKADFLKCTNWNLFNKMVDGAGCHPRSDDCLEATAALLCLTAFHDIMKVEALLPTVQEEHGPYEGFDAAVQIQDHDIALAYVLEHYPDLLPSFAVLPRAQQRSVLFTQGKLRFNHGWFVQAEAPPGPLLSDFKQALSSGVSSKDIGLYFLHWITDLAGAEGTPLAGAEKLTVRFPREILMSFLTSVPFLSRLVTISETELVEEYCKQRWSKFCQGEVVPTGKDAIARMRLVIMAQSSQAVQAFNRLPPSDRERLAVELSRTGCAGQRYASYTARGGPAFLVYYGPALLQRAAGSVAHLTRALRVISETLRGARALWPVQPDEEAHTVTLQIGELKSRPIDDVLHMSGTLWVLMRRNDLEATVELRRTGDLNALFATKADFRFLDFGGAKESPANSHSSLTTSSSPER